MSLEQTMNIFSFCFSFVPYCRGQSNKMHQGGNYQDLLKWGGGFLGHSLMMIK